MYGGGALLIRETVRRNRLGWPNIFVLALAYGVLEEGLIMQSLFNPNFLGLNQQLLQRAYIPTLGMGAWWTLFVLTLHTVWSIPVSIAICESLAPKRAPEPWLSATGLASVTIVFLAGCVSVAAFTVRNDPAHFVASSRQLACAASAFALLIAVGLLLPTAAGALDPRPAPRYLTVGLTALFIGFGFLRIPGTWGWWAVCLYLAIDAATIPAIRVWSRRQGWGAGHRLALSAGAALAYAFQGFIAVPAAGEPNRFGNTAFTAGLLLVLWIASIQIRRVQQPFQDVVESR